MNLLCIGFYGEGNLGDEAILEGISSSCMPGTALQVTAGKHFTPAKYTPSGGGCTRLPRSGISSWPDFLAAARKSDRVIVSGGILQDWSFEGVTFYALRMMACRWLGKSATIWGGGIGPLRGKATRALAKKALQGTSHPWFRDGESCRLFTELTGKPANLGTDWSWALPPDVDASKNRTVQSIPSDLTIGLNLRPWADRVWENVALKHLGKISILGISARTEDYVLLRQYYPGSHIWCPESFGDLFHACRHLQEGWAMRYHVVLAMLRSGIFVMPLPYDDKVRLLCEEAGLKEYACQGRQIPAKFHGWNAFGGCTLPQDSNRPRKADADFVFRNARRFGAMKDAFLEFCATSDVPREIIRDPRF